MKRYMFTSRLVRLGLVVFVIIAAFAIIAILASPRNAQHVVGVFLYSQHAVIDDIYHGFRSALDVDARDRGTAVQYIIRNANGQEMEARAIANYFRGANVDLILVVGLPAAQQLKAVGVATPVVFGGPPDPVAAGLVPRLHNHGTNFTGTRFFPSQDATVAVLRSLRPEADRIAVLHNPGEDNSEVLVRHFVSAATAAGLSVRRYPASDAPQLTASLRALRADRPHALFLPTDNYIYDNLDHVLAEMRGADIPVFSVTRVAVERGAMFGVGADYRHVGEVTASVAARILFDRTPVDQVDVIDVDGAVLYVRGHVTIAEPLDMRVERIDD